MKRRTALKLPLMLAAGAAAAGLPGGPALLRADAAAARWTADRANAWYAGQGWLVGGNYVTSTAINQLEMFQAATFDPQRINAELGAARWFGFNTVRVFLHDLLWAQDARGFAQRLSQFVNISAGHGIKPLFVLFDSCWDPHPQLGAQRAPRPGIHNSGWVQSPGADHLGDPAYRSVLQSYVTGVLNLFRNDNRILGWDLWNEPDNPASVYRKVERADKIALVTDLLPQVFAWARAVDPVQPLTSGVWQGRWANPSQRSAIASIQLDNSDIITFHSYANPTDFASRIGELSPLGRPLLCTEYLARNQGSTVEGILPVAKAHNVGVYSWGLVAGKTQTYFPWDSWDHPYTAEPKVWFSDLLYPNGRAFRDSEVLTVRKLAGVPGQA